ncbi:hypothetical protein TSAR_016713 [Trichomalopsis sarcophagae]|uniref:SET domain-containing protein n=1 Tax=Trichomalopsis sarcophagae TaxID=543379 RepID=A0A232FHQ6_9HYME|nr:hypothetical protein TSAR_016713 [Trichomalopsis sarcophagae]
MEPEVVDAELRRHLVRHGLLEAAQPTCWKIENSKLSGRGVIASRDIAVDELVYADAAVVQGPRCYSKYLPLCVSCYKTGCVLFPCDRGCGLPVCSEVCQNDPHHVEAECAYLKGLEPTCGSGWSLELLQAVVPIRALMLPKELTRVFYSLQCHEAAQHGREVDMLKSNVKGHIDADDEELMRRVCRAMDTNSFETAVIRGGKSTSLRALFPVGALTNHQCVPNTRHIVNAEGELLVYAAVPIAEGQEITMSYTDVLWDTQMRRHFLLATKHFACQCPRCTDISSIRAGIIAATEEFKYENPRKVLRFVEKELSLLVPETNYVMMEMMFSIVSLFGRAEGCTWSELTDEELDIKIVYCKKLIQCLDTLNCGNCTKKGLILYELYCANAEKVKRISSKESNVCTLLKNEIDSSANENVLLEAMKILKSDIVAPHDYREIYNEKLLLAQ